ncbi:hypothetical protein [Fictibacillus sp. NRS-1165]|uniref:hypothetical protein n=1 Tax=Fictibacillus sp. NRS-1165 TaxID=3144463 RepID=UPI003D1FB741
MNNKEAFSFNKIKVAMNNGQTFTADIGEVTINKTYKEGKILEQQIASSDNFSDIAIYQALKPITLTSISLPFDKDTERLVSVKANTNQKALVQIKNNLSSDGPSSWLEHNEKNDDGFQLIAPHKKFSMRLKKKDWFEIEAKSKPNTAAFGEFRLNFMEQVKESLLFLMFG